MNYAIIDNFLNKEKCKKLINFQIICLIAMKQFLIMETEVKYFLHIARFRI